MDKDAYDTDGFTKKEQKIKIKIEKKKVLIARKKKKKKKVNNKVMLSLTCQFQLTTYIIYNIYRSLESQPIERLE